MKPSPRILVIMGSVRLQRISPLLADWVANVGRLCLPEAIFELVDLRNWPLPMMDEPAIPAHATGYSTPHAQAWSHKIANADAFIFVTPQYNWGYPAALKNALDHLHHEWQHKPALIVSYGAHGGDKCAVQLRQVLTSLSLHVTEQHIELTLSSEQILRNDGHIALPEAVQSQDATLQTGLMELRQLLR
ncbi:MAG: NADPH-dependent FMN reductase [Paenalcaligenes sp.]